MLVSLKNDLVLGHYLPAKISTYMAAGKPIVGVLNGEGAKVINDADCGWCLSAGDADGLARLVEELSHVDKSVLTKKGENAAKYYNEHFAKEKSLKKLDELMGVNKV